MHITKIKLKSGEYIAGYIATMKPSEGFLELDCTESAGVAVQFVRKHIDLNDVAVALTENERYVIGACDELALAREYMQDLRRTQPHLPAQKWEATVICKFCDKEANASTAHLHENGWVGNECCWDERLRATE